MLCTPIAEALSKCGTSVVIVANANLNKAEKLAEDIRQEGGKAIALQADVLSKDSLEKLASDTLSKFGKVDYLINGAGGAKKEAVTSKDNVFFDLSEEAVRDDRSPKAQT